MNVESFENQLIERVGQNANDIVDFIKALVYQTVDDLNLKPDAIIHDSPDFFRVLKRNLYSFTFEAVGPDENIDMGALKALHDMVENVIDRIYVEQVVESEGVESPLIEYIVLAYNSMKKVLYLNEIMSRRNLWSMDLRIRPQQRKVIENEVGEIMESINGAFDCPIDLVCAYFQKVREGEDFFNFDLLNKLRFLQARGSVVDIEGSGQMKYAPVDKVLPLLLQELANLDFVINCISIVQEIWRKRESKGRLRVV